MVLAVLFMACQDEPDASLPDPDPVPPVDTVAEVTGFSGTLPVLYIYTDENQAIESKEEYVQAEWWLDDMGANGYESIGSKQAPLRMQIKGQGNYTWENHPKKSYRIKLDEKQELMGMKPNRHFCLLAHYDDWLARLKNTMGFELSRRIGLSYTPAQEPIEVVLNGKYIGLYFLTEKIRTGKYRVNIDEQCEGETDSTLIASGAWLLEIDNHPNDNCINLVEQESDSITITYHSPEHLSSLQERYLIDWLTRVNEAIYNPDKTNTEWERYIDIDTLAMYYIIAEMMDDIERFSGSCYMFKRQGNETKLIFGPVWDFGNAFNRSGLYEDTSFQYFLYEQPTIFVSHWIKEIVRFPHFQQVVRERWREFYGSGFNGLDIDRFADEFVESIKSAVQADVVLWPRYDIDIQKENFKQFIRRKIDWLQSQWGN